MGMSAAPLLVSPSVPIPRAPAPEPCKLIPFPERAYPRVWIWMEEFRDRVMDDFSPKTMEAYVENRRAASPYEMAYGVERGGELGGLISVQQVSPYMASAHCVFKKSFWGGETTITAVSEVFANVFGIGFQKISSIAFADNHQILALVRKLGGEKEGHLYRNTLRNGKPTDQMVLGIQQAAFEAAMEERRVAKGGLQ